MDSHSLEIKYQKDGAAFRVVLSTTSPDILAKAQQQKDVRNKTGEDLAAALIAYIKSKAVLVVERYKDGERHDGTDGEPAMQTFDEKGMIVASRHYRDGRLNNSLKGELALQAFDGKGRLIHAISYKNGVRLKELSEQERNDYQFWLAQKNAGKPQPDGKKPGPGSAKIG